MIQLTNAEYDSLVTTATELLDLIKSIDTTPMTTEQRKTFLVSTMYDADKDQKYHLWLAPKSSEVMGSWDMAMSAASTATIAGYHDWVLPNKIESLVIYQLLGRGHTPLHTFKTGGEDALMRAFYWTSGELESTSMASTGTQTDCPKTNYCCARFIRREYI